MVFRWQQQRRQQLRSRQRRRLQRRQRPRRNNQPKNPFFPLVLPENISIALDIEKEDNGRSCPTPLRGRSRLPTGGTSPRRYVPLHRIQIPGSTPPREMAKSMVSRSNVSDGYPFSPLASYVRLSAGTTFRYVTRIMNPMMVRAMKTMR